MRIFPTKTFTKHYKKLRNLKEKIDAKLLVFAANPSNPILKNHALTGTYKGCRSISVTGDYRIIYMVMDTGSVFLLDVGTHSELYR